MLTPDTAGLCGTDVSEIEAAVDAIETATTSLDTKTVHVDTGAVVVSSSALPTGASTEATLALIKAKTDNIDVALSTRAVTGLTDAQLRASAVPVSAAALPLPTGASTEATLATRTKPSDHQLIEIADAAQLDAFGRLRVSTPYTVFSSKMLVDNQPLIWDDQQTSGGGTSSTYAQDTASVTLLAAGNTAGRRLRQTKRRFNYQPGKSQLVMMTGVLAATGAGNAAVTRRLGLYDDNNGCFFEYAGSTTRVGLRTHTSGSPVDVTVAQTAWNLDKLDGTGASGITLDVTKAQLFVIDFQWLSVGRIRFGFDIGGKIIYVHQFLPANTQNVPSISSPNQPLRYEIVSAGGGSGTATVMQICATVSSEAGYDRIGFSGTADTGAVQLTTGNDTNIYALLALQFQAGKGVGEIIIDDISVMSITANASYRIVLLLNPAIAGTALVYNNIANSLCKFAVGDGTNTVTGGTPIQSFFGQSNHSAPATSQPSPDHLSIGTNIAGVSDILVLCAQPVPAQGATKFSGSLNWREVV